VINIIDDFNREALLNEAYYSIPATRLVQKIKEVLLHRAKPKRMFADLSLDHRILKDIIEKKL